MDKYPVGWLEEHSKLETMTAAAASPHLQTLKTWPVKFRLINRDTVLPSQVTTLQIFLLCCICMLTLSDYLTTLSSSDSSVHE